AHLPSVAQLSLPDRAGRSVVCADAARHVGVVPRPERRCGSASGRGSGGRGLSALRAAYAHPRADHLRPRARDRADFGRCAVRGRGHRGAGECPRALLLPLRIPQLFHTDAPRFRGARDDQDMAGASGQTADRLTAAEPAAGGARSGAAGRMAALERLSEAPHRFTLFAALRLLEQCFPDHPRLGESRKASDDPVRLGQAPTLSFAPSDVTGFDGPPGDGPARLEQYSFGIFGPNGALPVHLTEYAYERGRQREDATFTDFVNLFQHRLTSLF